jgi:hypothetical protein
MGLASTITGWGLRTYRWTAQKGGASGVEEEMKGVMRGIRRRRMEIKRTHQRKEEE